MTKRLYAAPGRLFVTVRITSTRNGRKYSSVETGRDTAKLNMKQEFPSARRKAIWDATYQHLARGGTSGVEVVVLDYDILYLDKKFGTRRRVVREPPAQGKKRGKRYFVTYDAVSNKEIARTRWNTGVRDITDEYGMVE